MMMSIYIFSFSSKVVLEREIKLKEFNFKILHGILPCNQNLKNWKIRLDDYCDVCNQSQTIEHLLYSCCYVKPLWQIVNTVFDINVSFKHILGLEEHFNYHAITTIVSFLIYKDWLLLSLENKKRRAGIVIDFFKHELKVRLEIYKQCRCIETKHIDNLHDLISHL